MLPKQGASSLGLQLLAIFEGTPKAKSIDINSDKYISSTRGATMNRSVATVQQQQQQRRQAQLIAAFPSPVIEYQFARDFWGAVRGHVARVQTAFAGPSQVGSPPPNFGGTFSQCLGLHSLPHLARMRWFIKELRMCDMDFSKEAVQSSSIQTGETRVFTCQCLRGDGQADNLTSRICKGVVSVAVMSDTRNPSVAGQSVSLIVWHPTYTLPGVVVPWPGATPLTAPTTARVQAPHHIIAPAPARVPVIAPTTTPTPPPQVHR